MIDFNGNEFIGKYAIHNKRFLYVGATMLQSSLLKLLDNRANFQIFAIFTL